MGRVAQQRTSQRLEQLLGEVDAYLAEEQPELTAEAHESGVAVRGKLVIADAEGPIDAYDIKMGVPASFPTDEPLVWEVGGRILRMADHHVFESSERCCLGVWEAWLARTQDPSFAAFMRGPVRDYFLGQSLVAVGEDWPYGELSHGPAGVLQAYGEALGIEADETTVRSYLVILSLSQVKGHHPCPCGSGLRLRKCHQGKVRNLSTRIDSDLANRMLKRLTWQSASAAAQ